MNHIEAMKQAYHLLLTEPHTPTVCDKLEIILRQAIAEAEKQEPSVVEFGMHCEKMMFKIGVQQFNLDYEPDTQDEFNFMREMLIKAFSTFTPNVKPQPKREWVGLTDEERNKIRFDHLDYDERASAIEAKLKEKNT